MTYTLIVALQFTFIAYCGGGGGGGGYLSDI